MSPRRAAPPTLPGAGVLQERIGSPWQVAGEGVPEGVRELGKLMMQVGIAVKQVMHAGGETQAAEAAKILAEARRSLYRILAEDEPA